MYPHIYLRLQQSFAHPMYRHLEQSCLPAGRDAQNDYETPWLSNAMTATEEISCILEKSKVQQQHIINNHTSWLLSPSFLCIWILCSLYKINTALVHAELGSSSQWTLFTRTCNRTKISVSESSEYKNMFITEN